jgi:hypothetical protein
MFENTELKEVFDDAKERIRKNLTQIESINRDIKNLEILLESNCVLSTFIEMSCPDYGSGSFRLIWDLADKRIHFSDEGLKISKRLGESTAIERRYFSKYLSTLLRKCAG